MAGAAAVQQRRRERGRHEPGRERVSDRPVRADRFAIGPTRQRVVAPECGALTAESGIVAMRSGLAVQARAHHHHVGFQLDQRVVVEAEAAHRARREVLRDRVGPLHDESSDERDGVRMLEVERDVALADVQAVVHRRAFESVRVVGTECVHAQEVGPRLRLDPQHRRAVLREVARRDRARGARAELQQSNAGPRLPALGRRVGPSGPPTTDARPGRAGAASPSAARTTTNERGNRSMPSTGPKNSRAASCADA